MRCYRSTDEPVAIDADPAGDYSVWLFYSAKEASSRALHNLDRAFWWLSAQRRDMRISSDHRYQMSFVRGSVHYESAQTPLEQHATDNQPAVAGQRLASICSRRVAKLCNRFIL